MTDFLYYALPDSVDRELNQDDRALRHWGSNQFRRIRVGDVVWIVTRRGGSLSLAGRMVVGEVADQATAAELLDCGPEDLWDASDHILALEGTVREMGDWDIQHLAVLLRFESPTGRDRLAILDDGSVSIQQLQTMRVLTANSESLLADVLDAAPASSGSEWPPEVEDYTRLRVHRAVERNPSLASKAAAHGFACQACGVDMERLYGDVGRGYIEAHYLVPVAELKGRVVRIDPVTVERRMNPAHGVRR